MKYLPYLTAWHGCRATPRDTVETFSTLTIRGLDFNRAVDGATDASTFNKTHSRTANPARLRELHSTLLFALVASGRFR